MKRVQLFLVMICSVLMLSVGSISDARVPGADLVLAKDTVPSGLASVTAGHTITYRSTVTNLGDDPAVDVLIYDETPSNTWYHSHATSPGASCVVNPMGLGGAEVTCTWTGTTAVSASRWLELTVTVCSGAMCGSNIVSDLAYALSDTLDPLPGNEQQVGYTGLGMVAAVTTPVTTQTAFSISGSAVPYAVSPGGQVTYTINVGNLGPSSAEAFVTTTLPSGWTVASADMVYNGGCSGIGSGSSSCMLFLGGTAICAPIWTSDTITIVANVPAGAPTAIVTASIAVESNNCLPDTGDLLVAAESFVGAIFVDGFESGSTSAWPVTTP